MVSFMLYPGARKRQRHRRDCVGDPGQTILPAIVGVACSATMTRPG
jgi:hypothetical protein